MPESVPYFQIIDEAGHPVHEADLFLRDTCARLGLLTTQRSYAFALLDWLQFLHGRRRKVNEVSRQDVVDYLLELRTKANPQRARRSAAAPRPGSINAVTGKSTLRPGYAPATIKQRLTVVGLFYDVLESAALGPPQHPLGRIKPGVIASDPKSYHYHQVRAFRQRVPQRTAHALPADLLQRFRDVPSSARDRALIEALFCTAGRAMEVLAMTVGDIQWEARKVMLTTKGQAFKTAVAVSSRLLVLLRDYLAERPGPAAPGDPLWLMERGKVRPMTYTALRAVLRRLNTEFGSNVTAHDFRATSATALASSADLPLLAVKRHLRHRDLLSTQRYLGVDGIYDAARISARIDSFAELDDVDVAEGYDAEAFNRVFGSGTQ